MRTIDADAARAAMLKIAEDSRPGAEECPMQTATGAWYVRMKTAEAVAEWLDALPTLGGWISVKERMPEREGLYLCWTVFNGEACYQIHLWKGGRWYWVHDVRYWMPLPEPPEEVQE